MRVVSGYLLGKNNSGQGRTGFIHSTEEEPYVGEKFQVPQILAKPLKIRSKVAVCTDYEMCEDHWALHLNPIIEDPCTEESMLEIST